MDLQIYTKVCIIYLSPSLYVCVCLLTLIALARTFSETLHKSKCPCLVLDFGTKISRFTNNCDVNARFFVDAIYQVEEVVLFLVSLDIFSKIYIQYYQIIFYINSDNYRVNFLKCSHR